MKLLSILLTVLLLPLAAQDRALVRETRKALVIGISQYPKLLRPDGRPAHLDNAAHDALDFARMLTTQGGFSKDNVEILTGSLSQGDIDAAVTRFYKRLQPNDLAIFYYAGHGVQIENDPSPNFLIPSEVTSGTLEVDLKTKAYPLSRVIERMEFRKARIRLVFVDACRDNPLLAQYRRLRGINSPTAIDTYRPPATLARGTVIGYAVSPGEQALEDSPNGRNGLYTFSLLRHLALPGADIIDALREVAQEVFQKSNEKMTPAHYGNFLGRLSLAGVTPTEPVKVVAAPPSAPVVGDTRSARQLRDGLNYVWIPAPVGGSFLMGCVPGDGECEDDEKPQKRVDILRGFWMAESETTQEAWAKIMGEGTSRFDGPTLPVENVTWAEANQYCVSLGLKLPTAIQWEWAARGGVRAPRYGELKDIAWTYDNSKNTTHPVKKLLPNKYGLYDMLGNVWEWTSTDYSKELKELRGGSWDSVSKGVRASFRNHRDPSSRDYLNGFRCAGELP